MKSFDELENMVESGCVEELRSQTSEQLLGHLEREEHRYDKACSFKDNKTASAAMFLQVCIERVLDERGIVANPIKPYAS